MSEELNEIMKDVMQSTLKVCRDHPNLGLDPSETEAQFRETHPEWFEVPQPVSCNHPCDETYHEDCPNCYSFLERAHAGEKDWQNIYGWRVN